MANSLTPGSKANVKRDAAAFVSARTPDRNHDTCFDCGTICSRRRARCIDCAGLKRRKARAE